MNRRRRGRTHRGAEAEAKGGALTDDDISLLRQVGGLQLNSCGIHDSMMGVAR